MATGWEKTYIKNGSKYKYVQKYLNNRKDVRYIGQVGRKSKTFEVERDAARFVDLKLIVLGKEPVNIFVRK